MLGRPVPSKYIRHQSSNEVLECNRLPVGYLLIEYIEETTGTMLSSTWSLKHDNIELQTNLFYDLSKIYLSLSKTPLPRIGSFIIENDGFLLLKNRPLWRTRTWRMSAFQQIYLGTTHILLSTLLWWILCLTTITDFPINQML